MPLLAESQVERALDNLDVEGAELPNAEEAQTPFPTSLILTREQEDELVNHCLNRQSTLENELGRIVQPEGQVPSPDDTTFLGRREKWTLRYYSHVRDRAKPGTIYEFSNITANLAQRITMQMAARANNFFFGTEPWFSVKPNSEQEKPLEDKIDRHSQWKLKQQGLKQNLIQSTEFAFVRGEQVTKTTYENKSQRYKTKGSVLVDAATGKPIYDAYGDVIFNDAMWIPEMGIAEEGPDPAQVAMGNGSPIQPTGRMVLKSDGVTIQPAEMAWQDGNWPRVMRMFEGARCENVFYKDFLCPLNVPDIHEADINIHVYSLPVMSLVEMCQRSDLKKALIEGGGSADLAALKKAVEAIRGMSGQGIAPRTGSDQPRGDFGEKGNQTEIADPDAEISECWVRFDVDGDGIQEEVMVVIDKVNRLPIFYDYTANITVHGRRPFEVVRGRPVDGRWYGIGAMEYFEPEQEFIDLLINRRNFRMSQAGTVTFWAPHLTLEGQAQPHLKLNHGKTYTLREGFKAEEVLSYVTLPDTGKDLMELLTFTRQLMDLKSGMINAADQEAADMKTSNTATGIRNVEKSGQEMFSQWLNGLEPGHEKTLKANILVTYRNMNKQEVFRFLDGETSGLDTLSPVEVQDLDFHVEILLTRVKAEQVIQTSFQASNLIKDFYSQPPLVQQAVAPFYKDSLRAMGYNNADAIIIPQQEAMPAQGGLPQPAGATGSESTKGISTPQSGTPRPQGPNPAI